MLSMTGYGKGTAECDGREMTVELKSVNHRFLDINIRMPRGLLYIEDDLRRDIGSRVSRGHIEVMLTYKNIRSDSKRLEVDHALLNAYFTAIDAIKSEHGLSSGLTAGECVRLPDVVTVTEEPEDKDILLSLMRNAVTAACTELISMRQSEGERLSRDLALKLDTIYNCAAEIKMRAPVVVSDYRAKLQERIKELTAGAGYDQSRFNEEVAYFADRASIDEELVRLFGHIEHVKEAVLSKEPIGRKLDFLVQEMNREANTIGSKASDMQILNTVVILKSEIEKLREQVQNIE